MASRNGNCGPALERGPAVEVLGVGAHDTSSYGALLRLHRSDAYHCDARELLARWTPLISCHPSGSPPVGMSWLTKFVSDQRRRS